MTAYEDLVEESEDLELFREFCGSLTTQQRQPMKIEPFQELSLSDHFKGAVVTVIIQPKKNGKSTIVAALCIYHALTVDDADVIIVANSKDQAKIVYRHIVKFIGKNPELQDQLDVKTGFNEVRVADGTGRIRVLASDDQTLEGVEPTLAIIDEYSQFDSDEVWGPLNDGLDTRKGRLVVITNAGSSEESPLGRLRARLVESYGVERVGVAYKRSRAPDGSEVLHEWGLDKPEQCEDLMLVKEANPASWMTMHALERRKRTSETRQRWLRMGCGLWVRGGETMIQPWEWDELPRMFIPRGSPCLVGVDIGRKIDPTAVVPLWWKSHSERVIGDPIILNPPGDDGRVDFRAIYVALAVMAGLIQFDRNLFLRTVGSANKYEAVEGWADAIEKGTVVNATGFVFDPNAGAEDMFERFQRKFPKVTPIEFVQMDSTLARADGRFMEALGNRWLAHSGHTELREHVLNAVERVTRNGSIFDHPKRPRKPQDALRAASMAHDTAVAHSGTVIKPKGRGVMIY